MIIYGAPPFMETPMCLNIPNGDTTGLVLQGGSICSMGNRMKTFAKQPLAGMVHRASFHGSNGDFSGFIQTLESE